MALPDIPLLTDPQTDDLANVLDWWACLGEEPVIIGTKTGRLQTTLRYVCPDTEQLLPEERASYLARLHAVLRQVDASWTLDFDCWHEPAPDYPETQWTDPVDWLVDEMRRYDFIEHPRHVSTAYCTLSWQPPSRRRQWLHDLFLTKSTVRRESKHLDDIVALCQSGIARFIDLLRPLLVQIEALDADETCTYLHQITSWERHRVRCPSPATDLDWQLSSSQWFPGQPPIVGGTVVEGTLKGGMFVQPLTIASWQESLGLWLPEALTKLTFPCRYHVRWVPMGTRAAEAYLRWEEKKWAGSYDRISGFLKKSSGLQAQQGINRRDLRTDAQQAGQSILDVQDEVLAGQEVLGMLSPTVLCWAEDTDLLEERVRALQAVMFQQGLVARVEEAGASLAWLASLPGHVHLGTRAFPLRTRELTGLMPYTSVWAGQPWNKHLQAPALMVMTTDGTPFWFCTHVGELGHILVVGPTRSGKSGLVGPMKSQWFRYPGARAAIFDRDYAHKILVLLRGGTHYDLGTPGCSGFHILGRIDTEAEQLWAVNWLEHVLTGEGLPPTPEERKEVWEALQRLAGLPPSQRTLSMYQRLMQVQRLKTGLEPFCQGGPFAWFDADEDAFGLAERLVCFEMSTILGQPRALGPCLSYLFHRLETEWFTGDPVDITIEEARWILALGPFLGEIELWLKARAKKNVSVTLVCQELEDLARTTAWHAILNSMPTKIALPNSMAFSKQLRGLYEEMGFDENGLHLIATGQPFQDYLYHSPLGTRRFQFRLSAAERCLTAASTLEELAAFEALRATVPQQDLAAAWLRGNGHEVEAGLIDQLHRAEGTPHDEALTR